MKILLISRIDNPEALEYVEFLAESLRDMGHSVFLEEHAAARLGVEGASIEGCRADLAVVVGGDGSMLLAVMRMIKQIPVLGINWGEVGFLSHLEPDNAISFFSHMAEPLRTKPRMRIDLMQDGVCMGTALNEALIVTSRPAKMLQFAVFIDGAPAGEFRADGILVSTPTGSTAYAMSAGGPIVDPGIEGILLVPLAPYLLSSRPLLIGSGRTVELHLEGTKPAKLVIDGQLSHDLETDTVIRVQKSAEPALFVDVGEHFFEKVEHKLRRL